MRMQEAERQRYIEEHAIPVGMPTVKDESGKTYGMDASNSANGISSNVFTLGGQSVPSQLFAWYASQSFIGYQACAIIAQQWLVNKACTQKGKDAVAKWFKMSVNDGEEVDPEVMAYIEERNKKMKLKAELVEAHQFNNVYGIRLVLFAVDSKDPKYYEKPFNPDGIKPGSYLGIQQIDPYWVAPNLTGDGVSDPINMGFYEPEHWVVSGRKIHKSHFVILRGAKVADFLKPSYLYGGVPLTQRIYERVYAAERTANEAPQLAMTKRLNVYKIKDMKAAIAQPKVLEQANQMMSTYRDNYGVLYAQQGEEVEQLETSLTDLDSTIMTQYQLVAAECNVPATKLLGTTPKGFNATGEFETETYHEELGNVQENEFDPIVEKHLQCLMKSEVEPKFGQEFEITVTWNPLSTETRKEQAEINNLNAQTYKTLTAEVGSVSAEEVRDALIADEHSGFNGLEPMENDELDIPEGFEDDPVEPTAQDQAEDVIEKEGDKYYVYSEEGKRLSKGYTSRKDAESRLQEIEYFKHNSDEFLTKLAEDEDAYDAEYQGKKVTLNKPFSNKGGSSKYAVYVKNEKGNVVKVSFGDPNMEIRRDNPEARKNFRARHNCSEKTDKTKAGYWSCKLWSNKPVSEIVS